MAEGTKPWYTSKTIWSDVLTIALVLYGGVVTVLQAHGIHLPAPSEPIFGTILTILASFGIVGRVTATTTIGPK